MEEKNWIYAVLNSTDGMTNVVPNELLYSKIIDSIEIETKVSKKWIYYVAAIFILLFSINSIVLNSIHMKNSNKNSFESLGKNFSNNNQLY